MTTVFETIQIRRSCRTFIKHPVESDKMGKIQSFCHNNNVGPLNNTIRFHILNFSELEKEEIKSLGTYGVIQGASQFLVGHVDNKKGCLVDFGYCMEKVILYCTGLDLGTCWLGGTFKRAQFAQKIQIKESHFLPAITPVGYAKEKPSITDSLFRIGAGSTRRKAWHLLFYQDNFKQPLNPSLEESCRIPLEAVRLAPSASNKQPWRIVKEGDDPIFHFFLKRTRGYNRPFSGRSLQDVDMGIAMCHFELVSREFDNGGRWMVEPPEFDSGELEYVASWINSIK